MFGVLRIICVVPFSSYLLLIEILFQMFSWWPLYYFYMHIQGHCGLIYQSTVPYQTVPSVDREQKIYKKSMKSGKGLGFSQSSNSDVLGMAVIGWSRHRANTRFHTELLNVGG